MKTRRTVETTDRPRRRGGGRGPRLWAYGYADLAKLLGMTEQAVRARVARGWNPGDLEAICREWVRVADPGVLAWARFPVFTPADAAAGKPKDPIADALANANAVIQRT